METHYYIWRQVPEGTFVSMATTMKTIQSFEASMISKTDGPLENPYMSVYQKNDSRTRYLDSSLVRWVYARFWGVNTAWFMFSDDDLRYIPQEITEGEFKLSEEISVPHADPKDFRLAGNYTNTTRSTFSPDALNIDEAAKKRLRQQLRTKEKLDRRF
jgi:hypothetical protein